MSEDIGNPAGTTVVDSPVQGTSQATSAEGTEKAPETPFFFSKAKANKGEEASVDPSKLPPELQPIYKSMQADYTRKTQEAADMRRTIEAERKAFQDSQQMFREYLDRTIPKPHEQANSQADVAGQIRTLREEGRHDEADAILLQVAQTQAQAQLNPLKEQAEIANRQATFRDIVSELQLNDPLVKTYGRDIAQVFDAQTPVMAEIRNLVLSDAGKMRTLLPVVLRALATEQHAMRLEANFEASVDRKVTERLAAERSKAMGIPARLVESGSTSRSTGSPKGLSLDAAINNALERHYGG